MLQNAPLKFLSRGSMLPNPPSKRAATPRIASPPPPQKNKIVGPLANPAYAHELQYY